MALSTRSGQTAVDRTERHGAGDLRRRAAEADMSAGVVFVVDDDAAIRHSLRRLITSVGSTVEVFPSARAFLEARRPDAPGCLLLDVIAGELGTSEATVKEQRGHVMAKMQAGSVADLVRLATRLGSTSAGAGQLRA